MEFSAKEKKAIIRLQKQQRLWPLRRWILVFDGFLAAGLSVFILVTATNNFNERSRQIGLLFSPGSTNSVDVGKILPILKGYTDDAFIFSVFSLMGVVLGGMSLIFFIITITSWHENTNRTLLLKLVEAKLEEETNRTPALPLPE
jgi:hypothetical protein